MSLYVPEQIPPAATRRPEDRLSQTAEALVRRCHEAIRQDQTREFTVAPTSAQCRAGYFAINRKVKPLEETALRPWAQENGLLLDAAAFTVRWQQQGEKGETEHQLYFDPETQLWFKRNNLSNHGNWLEYFQRLALHNWLFPEAALQFAGFMEVENELLPVVSQPDIQAVRGATPVEVDHLMQQLGFEAIRTTNPARQFDYIHRQLGVEGNDLHGENVLVNEAGQLFVIDPVPMMEQESKLRRLSA